MEGGSKSSSRIEIPESVAMEILSKLPVKSLLRFRCVCKHWCSSFQTSYFITKHLRNNNNNNLNLLAKNKYRDGAEGFICFHVSAAGQDFVIKENIHTSFPKGSNQKCYGQCNGLICLHADCDWYDDKVGLWNPSTREFKVLPKSTTTGYFHSCRFGYDSTTNDYKVVRFVSNYQDEDEDEDEDEDDWMWTVHQVELYSLKSDYWKEISAPKAKPYEYPSFFVNFYVNGCCYWKANEERYKRVILSFDMANEKFSTLPFPNCDRRFYLVDYKGMVGALAMRLSRTPNRIVLYYSSLELWVMNDGSWTNQFTVELVPGIGYPLGFWMNGEIFLETSNQELLLFDPATKHVKNLGVKAYTEMKLITYVESLVPINGRGEDIDGIIIRQPAGDLASNTPC